MYVTDIDDGEYIRLRGVDFQEKVQSRWLFVQLRQADVI